jgi:Arc/MetJ-type ribon-helix-helix transcriptional regulator
MRTTKSVTISLPPEQLKTAERLARRQSRTMSELFREGLRRLEQEEEQRSSPLALRDLRTIIQLIQQEARRTGLNKMTAREINAEVTAARKEMVDKSRKSKKRAGR